MKVLFVSSEVHPYSKTGGLADVSGALPRALRASSHEVMTVTPHYRTIDASSLRQLPGSFPLPQMDVRLTYTAASDPETGTWFLTIGNAFDRDDFYGDSHDEPLRWAAFCHAALDLATQVGFRPDLIHVNDWQTGLIPLILHNARHPLTGVPSMCTIHNLGYQGRFGMDHVADLGVPPPALEPGDGSFSFLEVAIRHATVVTTVSPTYAREIQTPEGGAGLHDLLAARSADLHGILNGIDIDEWNPATDPHLAARYSDRSLWRKELNKEALLNDVGLPHHKGVPVLGMISRLAYQKGIEIMRGPLVHFLEAWDVRVVLLGSGEQQYADFFRWLTTMNPDKVAFIEGYDNALSHRIEAGVDLFLMPSLYEPCGLNQMYSQRYGTLPVVRRVGGLADTVEHVDGDTGNGFVFDHYTEDGLGWAIGQGLTLHADPRAWRAAQVRAMAIDHSWEARAAEYVALYAAVVDG